MHNWENKIEEVWKDVHVSILLCSVAFCTSLWALMSLPLPGVSIGILGVVAAVMSLRGEMRPVEKTAWIVILTMLLVAELRSITKNNAQVASDREVQNRKLQTLNNELSQSISENQSRFRATIDGLGATLSRVDKTVRQTEPHALVRFENFAFTPEPSKIEANARYRFNTYFVNGGTENASRLNILTRIYVAKPDDRNAQKKLAAQFEREWGQEPHIKGETVIPNALSFRTDDKTFTSEDVRGFNSGKATIYYLVRFQYSDETGRWRSDTCRSFQNNDGSIDLTVSHPCRVFENQRYAAHSRNAFTVSKGPRLGQ